MLEHPAIGPDAYKIFSLGLEPLRGKLTGAKDRTAATSDGFREWGCILKTKMTK